MISFIICNGSQQQMLNTSDFPYYEPLIKIDDSEISGSILFDEGKCCLVFCH